MKKPRKAEANFYSSLPAGETPESLEKERELLLKEVKKRNNDQTIGEKMDRTFVYRRQEVVDKQPGADEYLQRWPT